MQVTQFERFWWSCPLIKKKLVGPVQVCSNIIIGRLLEESILNCFTISWSQRRISRFSWMHPLAFRLEIYFYCIKMALVAIMEESAQYHTTWPLLRPHADQVMQCTGEAYNFSCWTQCPKMLNLSNYFSFCILQQLTVAFDIRSVPCPSSSLPHPPFTFWVIIFETSTQCRPIGPCIVFHLKTWEMNAYNSCWLFSQRMNSAIHVQLLTHVASAWPFLQCVLGVNRR